MISAVAVTLILILSSYALGDINDYAAVYKPISLSLFKERAGRVEALRKKLDIDTVDKLSSLYTRHIVDAMRTVKGVSKGCQESFDELTADLKSPWVLQVFDSWGKIGDGILGGRVKLPGNFDECKNTSGQVTKSSVTFLSKYCTVYVPVTPNGLSIEMGSCVPRQCSNADVTALYNEVLSKIPRISLQAMRSKCQNQDYTLEGGRIAALFFVILMVGLCSMATLFDGIYQLVSKYMNRSDLVVNQEGEATPLLSSSAPKPAPPGVVTQMILSFSFYSNINKIMNTIQPPGAITCLNGIRFFSMTWVILGHTLMTIQNTHIINNPLFLLELYKRFATQAIVNATVSVDTFFILSGLLVAYLFLKDFHKRRATILDFAKGLPLMYLHRYIRLTPAYGFMILIYSSLFWFLADGPFWPSWYKPPYRTFDQNCESNWYLNILYVNNLFDLRKQCVIWGWYLANDTQYFLIAPFIVYLMYRFHVTGVVICIVSILGSNLAALIVSGEQHDAFATSPTAHNNVTVVHGLQLPYYFVPWTRYQTYGIGLLTGFLIFELRKKNFKIPAVLNVILWGISAALCMAVVYGPYDANMGYHTVYLAEDVAYNGLARTAWGLGIAFVMISCSLGQGGWVDEFLSWKGFVPLGRLTYCAYLIHIPCINLIYSASRQAVYYTDLQLAKDVILCTTVAYLVAFIFSLLFEMPFICLDKLLLAPLSLKKGRDEKKEDRPTQYVTRENRGYTQLLL